MVLLLSMITPVEAAGTSAAATVVAGAATSVVAAGAERVLNYWEEVEEETAGDLRVKEKETGTLRSMATNLRRVKREQGTQEMAKVVWERTLAAVTDASVDVWAASDTGVDDAGAPGQALLWGAGKLQDEVSFGWGGRRMGWTHQQGHKGRQGLRRGGVFLAVKEQWRAEMHKVEVDSRGWGRYVMRELLGRSGASLVVVSMYLPTRSSSKQPGGGA